MRKTIVMLLICASLFLLAGCESGVASKEPITEKVENMEYTIRIKNWDSTGLELEEFEQEGTYTGEVKDGVPNGVGQFDEKNDKGEVWHYQGEFVDGVFHGQGKCFSDEDDTIIEEGTYKDGTFTPTLSEFVATVPQMILNDFVLSETSAKFIDSHENLFPCKTEEDVNQAISLTDKSIEYAKLAKNTAPYLDKFFALSSLIAEQVFEYNAYGYTYTTILARDSNFNYYMFYYNGSVDVYEGDAVNFRGIPLAYSNFDNVSNGQTLVVVAFGSIIEKVG